MLPRRFPEKHGVQMKTNTEMLALPKGKARTIAALKALKLPEGKLDAIAWDPEVPGFGLRLRQAVEGDLRAWVYQYRFHGRSRRYLIAKLDEISPAEALAQAKDLRAKVRLGCDPQQEREDKRREHDKEKNPHTMLALTKMYLEGKKDEVRERSYTEFERYLTGDYFKTLHALDIAAITRRDVALCINEIAKNSGKSAAVRARSSLSAFCRWCMTQGLAEANPTIGTQAPRQADARDHVLPNQELAAVWRACEDDEFGRIVRLCILLGQRRSEIGGMRWSEFDFDKSTWTLPKERAKNHCANTLPLPPLALDIVQSVPRVEGRDNLFGVVAESGFTLWVKAKHALDKRLGKSVRPFVLHDLRRSTATGMADIGTSPYIVEQILNHQSGHKSGIAGIYNRSAYEREVRNALALWADHVRSLVEGDRKVIKFPVDELR
jgi:integrase